MKTNVLVFPCGSQSAIDINFCLRESLRFEVYGASSVDDHGKFVYKNYIGNIPTIHMPEFIDRFNEIILENLIEYIIPTHDTIVYFLLQHQDQIRAKVVASPLQTAELCRYKSLTYHALNGEDFVPAIFEERDVKQFPVFLKPDVGQGAQRTHLIQSQEQLYYHLQQDSDLLICEYLPGPEITIDCFTDRLGALRLISPRTRERTLAGMSTRSKWIPPTDEMCKIVMTINQKVKFRGCWFVQLKQDQNGKYKLLEISTRLAGTSAVTFNRDVNLPLLSLLDLMELDIDITPNDYPIEIDRSFINRYNIPLEYERVYVDLDDTLLMRDSYCNEYLMFYLYQCLNKNRELILITRHADDINRTLDRYRISPSLFSHIVKLDFSQKKYQFMKTDKRSIFIDNSFAERREVKEHLQIPAFDINNIECLIDWRG